jgi:hypothetical protein
MRKTPPILLLLLATAACTQTDSFNRPGAWHSNGANEQNLRAMIAVPEELVQGTGATGADAQTAAAAVTRLREDRVRPLPASNVATISVTGAGSAGGN